MWLGIMAFPTKRKRSAPKQQDPMEDLAQLAKELNSTVAVCTESDMDK